MAENITINPNMIDWDTYKESIAMQLQNEHLWSLGGAEFATANIAELEEEIELIEEESYQFVFDKYDEDFWKDFIKK